MAPYDESYLEDVQTEMGVLFYIACTARHDYDSPEAFACSFADSSVAHGIEAGNVHYLVGTCGIEWYAEIVKSLGIDYTYAEMRKQRYSRDDAFWCGSVIAYYQWSRGVPFSSILTPGVLSMLFHAYGVLHEMEFVPIEAANFLDRVLAEDREVSDE